MTVVIFKRSRSSSAQLFLFFHFLCVQNSNGAPEMGDLYSAIFLVLCTRVRVNCVCHVAQSEYIHTGQDEKFA